jgi:hypothetical protein
MADRTVLSDRSWLVEEATHRTATEIARELGCAPGTVLRAMRLHGIPVNAARGGRRSTQVELDDRVWLAHRYRNASAPMIAKELGVAPSTVLHALQRHGIPVRTGGERQRFRAAVELHDPHALRDAYRTRAGTAMAHRLSVTPKAVYDAMKRNGVEVDGPWVRRDTTRLTRPSTGVLERLWRQHGEVKQIGRELGVSPGKAAVWLAEVGIFVHDAPVITVREVRHHIAAGWTIAEISRAHHVGYSTVAIELRRHGLVEEHRQRPRPGSVTAPPSTGR